MPWRTPKKRKNQSGNALPHSKKRERSPYPVSSVHNTEIRALQADSYNRYNRAWQHGWCNPVTSV
jgi:hypothetical protein